jgi:hypothetical protein
MAQDPLNKLSNLLRTGIDLLPSFRQISNTDSINHTDPMGEELNETSERVTSGIFIFFSPLTEYFFVFK